MYVERLCDFYMQVCTSWWLIVGGVASLLHLSPYTVCVTNISQVLHMWCVGSCPHIASLSACTSRRQMVKKLPFFSVIVDGGEDDSGGYIITLFSNRLTAPLKPVQGECPPSQ